MCWPKNHVCEKSSELAWIALLSAIGSSRLIIERMRVLGQYDSDAQRTKRPQTLHSACLPGHPGAPHPRR